MIVSVTSVAALVDATYAASPAACTRGALRPSQPASTMRARWKSGLLDPCWRTASSAWRSRSPVTKQQPAQPCSTRAAKGKRRLGLIRAPMRRPGVLSPRPEHQPNIKFNPIRTPKAQTRVQHRDRVCGIQYMNHWVAHVQGRRRRPWWWWGVTRRCLSCGEGAAGAAVAGPGPAADSHNVYASCTRCSRPCPSCPPCTSCSPRPRPHVRLWLRLLLLRRWHPAEPHR